MSAIYGIYGTDISDNQEAFVRSHDLRGSVKKNVNVNKNSLVGVSSHRGDQVKIISSSHHEVGKIPFAIICGDIYNDSLINWNEWFDLFLFKPAKAINEINGSFIISGIDLDGQMILARDHIGEKIVFYSSKNNVFVFSSSLRSVAKFSSNNSILDPVALAQYLTYSFVPKARTLVSDVFELLPGQMLMITQDGKYRRQQYYTLPDLQNVLEIGNDEALEYSSHLLELTIKDRLKEDVNPSVYLSGGLDSSLVAAKLNMLKNTDKALKSYSIHYGKKYPNELEYARQMAGAIQSDHYEVELKGRFVSKNFHEMSQVLDQPIGDPVTIGNFFLGKTVRNEVDCVFNGEGGDPCFGGPKNIPMLLNHWYFPQEAVERKREEWYLWSYDRCFGELSNLLLNYDEEEMLEFISEPVSEYLSPDRPGTLLKKMLLTNIVLKGSHLILPKVEQITSYFGIRVCSPLFDRRLVELALTLPDSLLMKNGVDKIILRNMSKGIVPNEIISREKSGMRIPVHFWFQGSMKRSAKKFLLSRAKKKDGLFDHNRIKQIVNYDTGELRGRHGLKTWMLYNLELWREKNCV